MSWVCDIPMASLAAQPCVVEVEQMAAELLELPGKLRKGMAPR